MAISTFKVYLMMKAASGSAYSKLVDIKDFPDLGGSPEMIETTTLSDYMQTFIEGIQKMDGLEFTANYTKSDFKTLSDLKGVETDFAVWFGASRSGTTYTPDGSDGKFEFKGTLSVYVVGAGNNEVVEMKVTIAPSTPIEMAE